MQHLLLSTVVKYQPLCRLTRHQPYVPAVPYGGRQDACLEPQVPKAIMSPHLHGESSTSALFFRNVASTVAAAILMAFLVGTSWHVNLTCASESACAAAN
jgi:hypothetical protein